MILFPDIYTLPSPTLTATYVISVTPHDSPLSPPVIYRIHEAENI